MIDTPGVLRPPTKAVLDKLSSVPVDSEPRFVIALDPLKEKPALPRCPADR